MSAIERVRVGYLPRWYPYCSATVSAEETERIASASLH